MRKYSRTLSVVGSLCVTFAFSSSHAAQYFVWSGLGTAPECIAWVFSDDPREILQNESAIRHPPVTPPAISAAPLTYKDERTNILFYVESDGRHLSAIGSANRVLWTRNPFVDSKLCPYRGDWPTIVSVQGLSDKDDVELAKTYKRTTHFIAIRFGSSQFGVVDTRNGDFFWGGQD